MKKGFKTIIFMVVITIIFISSLASINELTRERISQNMKVEMYKSILYSFDIFPEHVNERDLGLTGTTADIPWEAAQVIENIQRQLRKVKLAITPEQKKLLANSYLTWQDSVEIEVRIDENAEILAFGFPLRGKGLWGTITAFGVISANLQKMVGIDFTEQVETPGLGARITESEFKYFFRNLDLSGFTDSGSTAKPVMVVKVKEKSNAEKSTNTLQAITGATQTVDGVLKMINTDLKFYLEIIRTNLEKIKAMVS